MVLSIVMNSLVSLLFERCLNSVCWMLLIHRLNVLHKLFEFCCCSLNVNIVCFEKLCHINFKLKSVITLKYLWVFKRTTFVIYCFQHKYNLNELLVLRAQATFYLDATPTFVNMCLYVFSSKKLSYIKNWSHWCCSLGFFTSSGCWFISLEGSKWTCLSIFFFFLLTWVTSFFAVDLISSSS